MYVDGFSLYSAYFVPDALDPSGWEERQQSDDSKTTDYEPTGRYSWTSWIPSEVKRVEDECGKCKYLSIRAVRYKYEVYEKYYLHSEWTEQRSWAYKIVAVGADIAIVAATGAVGFYATQGAAYAAGIAAAGSVAQTGVGGIVQVLTEDLGWSEVAGSRRTWRTSTVAGQDLRLKGFEDDYYTEPCPSE
jgi:hypothetical protein